MEYRVGRKSQSGRFPGRGTRYKIPTGDESESEGNVTDR